MSQVVFIAGMHRSGTSMVTRLLNLCGLYLGSESELMPPNSSNTKGYWENSRFTLMNDELLNKLGGGWDHPPKISPGWEKSQQLLEIRRRAGDLIEQFSAHKYWGWKDPRNSLTYPFWNELMPSMKVVICVRNPIEVTHSLLQRNHFSPALAFNIWFEYNQRILKHTQPQNRIITDYNSYFQDPGSELTRILDFLELDCPQNKVKHALETIDIHLRHNQSTLSDLILEAPVHIIDLYQKMYNPNSDVLLSGTDSDLESTTVYDPQINDLLDKDVIISPAGLKLVKDAILEKEKDIQFLQTQLRNANIDIQSLQTQLNTRQNELSEIYRSKAWRMIQFFRKTRKRIFGYPPDHHGYQG